MSAITLRQCNRDRRTSYIDFYDYYCYPRETRWNRSIGPLILTTMLAPAAWTVMGFGYLLLGLLKVALLIKKQLEKLNHSGLEAR